MSRPDTTPRRLTKAPAPVQFTGYHPTRFVPTGPLVPARDLQPAPVREGALAFKSIPSRGFSC